MQFLRGKYKPLMLYFTILVACYVLVSLFMYIRHDVNKTMAIFSSTYLKPRRSTRTLFQGIAEESANLLTRVKIKAGLGDTWCDLPLVGEGCYLRDKLTCDGLPTIHSAFADINDRQLVFVGIRLKNDTWHKEQYYCEFSDAITSVSDPIIDDSLSFGGQPQYVIIITCPIPEPVFNLLEKHKLINVSFRRSSELRYAYVNIPICASAERKKFLALCTMVKDMDQLIPDWLTYYLYMGVEHVYIYDNSLEADSTLTNDLKLFTEAGLLTIIPWSHTYTPWKTYLEVQIAHENDCMWRHRHDTHWMIKVDVDEFIQPMNQSKPKIVDYLNDSTYNVLAALRMRNWFFGRPPNASESECNALTAFERNTWRQPEPTAENRGRDKSIARPINIHYYKIHGVKLGGETLSLDPYSELRLVHYRTDNPRHRGFKIHQFVRDTSMVELWKDIKKWFNSHQYHHSINPR